MFKVEGWENLASRLFYGLLIVVPLAFWPGSLFTFSTLKVYLFFILLLVVAAAYLLLNTNKGAGNRLSSWWVVALWTPVVATFFSSLTSGAMWHSLIGTGVEPDTFLSVFMLALLASLIPLVWTSRREIFNTLLVVSSLTLIVAIFQILLLLGNFTTLDIFNNPVVNLIGKWNELGIFMGLGLIVSLCFIEFLPWRQTKLLTILTISTFTLSLLSAFIINFNLAWLLIALIAALIFLIKLFTTTDYTRFHPRRFLTLSSVVVVIALILFWFGQVGNTTRLFGTPFDLGTTITNLNNRLGIQMLEVYPSWEGTWMIAKSALNSNPILGVGPNKFSNEWFRARPISVNDTPFWQDDFRYGSGLIPSSVVTGGLVTLATYILLLGTVIVAGWRLWRRRQTLEPLVFKLGIITWLVTVYLWAFSVIYIPGITIVSLTFFFTGLLIVALNERGPEVSPAREEKAWLMWLRKWVAVFGTTVGVVVVLILLALVLQSVWSSINYGRALKAAINGDLPKAEVLLSRAVSLNHNDLYYRSLADLDLAFMNELFQMKDLKPEEAQARFQTILSAAIGNAQDAKDYNPTNYLNWTFLARVYESVVPLKVEGAYQEALKSYNEAKRLNPSMPSVWLDLARLEVAAGNNTAAREYLDQALKLKRNYTEAIFVLAQLDSATGNLNRSIALAEQGTQVSPGDPVSFFGLGLLNYQAGNFTRARDALEQAVRLNPNYGNARYFLGLSYDALGANARALEQFKILLTANNTAEIKQIVTNLEAGRRALSNTPPPAPEDRDDLPVKDEE
ncbi:MAG: tetratricopeptide repeat protein [Candidatus Pacebacteria bacterium]|nr:tetratricopeptide repeat protein [Candidatus Paceibacterota bacterium]